MIEQQSGRNELLGKCNLYDPNIHIIIQPDYQGHPASVSNAPVHRHEHHRRTLSSRTSSSSSSTSSFLRFSTRLRTQDSRSRLSFYQRSSRSKSCWSRHVCVGQYYSLVSYLHYFPCK